MSLRSTFSRTFQTFAANCSAVAIQQQDLFNQVLGIEHRNIDLRARMLTGGGLTLGGVTGLGSFSHISRTWLWLWDNPAFTWEHPAVAPLRTIHDFGEQQGIPELTTGHLDLSGFANPHGAATIIAITSAYVLGGHGVWSCRINTGKGSAYIHVDDPRLPVARFDAAATPALVLKAAGIWPAEQRAIVQGLFQHFNVPYEETAEQITGRHRGGAPVTVRFDARDRITAISASAGADQTG